jgi:hypothetical protein
MQNKAYGDADLKKHYPQQWLLVIACSRLLLKTLADFQFIVYLQSLLLTHATTHSRDVSGHCKGRHLSKVTQQKKGNEKIYLIIAGLVASFGIGYYLNTILA